MEIKLNAGDKITIPAGCKAIIEDNLIIIEEKKEEFKDGDILHSYITGRVVIFKSYENESRKTFCVYYNSANTPNNGWFADCFRIVTEEEKQAFFDELWAKGLRWNEDTMQMEKVRFRAALDEDYLYIDRGGNVLIKMEGETVSDDKNYNSGNYYLLEERAQAEEDAKAIKAIFEKRLKAI